MRRASAVLVLVAAALSAAACGGLGEADAPQLTPVSERAAAPDFTAPALEGEGDVSLADLRGRPALLNFWASWCGPCRDEMPELARFARENPEIGVVGIAVNDLPADSRRFADRVGADFTLAVDRQADTAGRYGVTGLPATVVVDAEGRVAATVFGPVDRDDLEGVAEQLGAHGG